jgi:hypothetical protein
MKAIRRATPEVAPLEGRALLSADGSAAMLSPVPIAEVVTSVLAGSLRGQIVDRSGSIVVIGHGQFWSIALRRQAPLRRLTGTRVGPSSGVEKTPVELLSQEPAFGTSGDLIFPPMPSTNSSKRSHNTSRWQEIGRDRNIFLQVGVR